MFAILFTVVYLVYGVFNLSGKIDGYNLSNVMQISIIVLLSGLYAYSKKDSKYKREYILAYVVRLMLLLFSVYGRNIALLPFDGCDTEHFYSAVYEKEAHVEYGKDFLVTMTATLSYLLGDARLLYQYIMLVITMLGLKLTELSLKELEIDDKVTHVCLFLAAVFPSFAMFGIIYSREAIVSTGTVGSFLLFVRYLKEKNTFRKLMYVILSLTIVIVTCLFHAAPAAVLVGYIGAILVYDYGSDKYRVTIRSAFASAFFLLFLIAIFFLYPSAFEKLRGISDVKSIAGRFMFDSNLEAGSSYAQYVGDSDTWGRFIFFTPIRMFYGMFAPFPWEWRGLADVATFFSNSLFYLVVCLIAVVNVFRRNYWSNFNRLYAFTLTCAAIMVGWGSVAFGTAIRHRDKFFLLFVVLLAIELCGKNKRVVGDCSTESGK